MLPEGPGKDARSDRAMRLNLLILYDQASVHINTVRDHLDSFRLYSRHNVSYANAVGQESLRFPLDLFDVVIVHYSVRLAFNGHLAPEFAEALRQLPALKVLFIQDEYDNTWRACHWINQLGIRVVFSCVPLQHVPKIYSRVDRNQVEFFPVLTGYLPLHLDYNLRALPLPRRPIVIGYRGRPLPYRYGRLSREKLVIGQRMRQECEARGIRHNIEWTEERRIYGEAWIDFIASCRATLGTESGSNVFDYDGSLTQNIYADLIRNPSLTFEEIFEKYLKAIETEPIMNQISPRIFEAVALKTGLILFEGEYSGVLRPHEHYIPLKKDFSNVEEVFSRVQNDTFLGAMVDRAYQHVIASGNYTYQKFVAGCEEVIAARVKEPRGHRQMKLAGALDAKKSPAKDRTGTGYYSHPIAAATQREPVPRRGLLRAVASRCRRYAKWLVVKIMPLVNLLLHSGRRQQMAHCFVMEDPQGKAAWDLGSTSPAVLKVAGKQAYFQELVKLRVLKWCFQECPYIPAPYWIKICFLAAEMRLEFTSLLISDECPGSDSTAIPWSEIEERLRKGDALTVLWDHSRIGTNVCFPLDSVKVIKFDLGSKGIYTFRGVSALARDNPPAALSLLKHVTGARETPVGNQASFAGPVSPKLRKAS